jgi:PAS domain S-box-containing protein
METAGSCDTLSVRSMGAWLTYSSTSEHYFTDVLKQLQPGAGFEATCAHSSLVVAGLLGLRSADWIGMGNLFREDWSDEPTFVDRLRALLDEVRAPLGVEALALWELAAVDGRMEPTCRACSPVPAVPLACELELFNAFAADPRENPSTDAALSAVGLSGSWRLTARPLSITPAVSGGPDAMLLLAHGERDLDDSALYAFSKSLEQGLSVDRRRRLADVVFTAVSQAADPIELTDAEARLFYANEAWERFFRYPRAAALGQTVGRLLRDPVDPLHDRAFYQFTLATLAGGRSWLGALACRTEDGKRVFCEAHVSPFVADPQGFRGNLAIRRDIAHRRERDEALAIAHQEFRAVLAAIPDGVAVLRDGLIYFANAALLAMLKIEEQALIGRAYRDFIHPEDRAEFDAEEGAAVRRVRMLPSDGVPRFVEISTAGAVSFEAKPAEILLARDTTDYHIAQEQLARSDKLSALGSLAAGVAHEINNPLAYVVLNLELIRQHGGAGLEPDHRDALDEALDGAKRIRQILTELRGFSGSDSPGPPEAVEVAKVVSSALNIVQNEVRHRATVVRRLSDGLFALAREGQLVQVLVNLLVNAAQAIPGFDPSAHRIVVSAEPTRAGRIEITVADSGLGIPEPALAHVFDAFATGKRRGEGSGLGLTITKRIVESLDGSIRIESTVGKGTTVRVELPSARRPSSVPVNNKLELPAPTEKRARVLVVDDEALIGRALARILAKEDVVMIEDARKGLALVEQTPGFDVVLCDLMMPGMSGQEFYRAACRLRPELEERFVFMTGGAFTDVGNEFLESLGSRVIYKPFDPARVITCVHEVARNSGRSRRLTT